MEITIESVGERRLDDMGSVESLMEVDYLELETNSDGTDGTESPDYNNLLPETDCDGTDDDAIFHSSQDFRILYKLKEDEVIVEASATWRLLTAEEEEYARNYPRCQQIIDVTHIDDEVDLSKPKNSNELVHVAMVKLDDARAIEIKKMLSSCR